MPGRIGYGCKVPYCRLVAVRGSGYCLTHKPKKRDPIGRRTAYQRGYTGTWQKARKQYLSKNPICVKCKSEKRLTLATVVDHIIDHKGDGSLFWDKDNWQALCKRCHDKKPLTSEAEKREYEARKRTSS